MVAPAFPAPAEADDIINLDGSRVLLDLTSGFVLFAVAACLAATAFMCVCVCVLV